MKLGVLVFLFPLAVPLWADVAAVRRDGVHSGRHASPQDFVALSTAAPLIVSSLHARSSALAYEAIAGDVDVTSWSRRIEVSAGDEARFHVTGLQLSPKGLVVVASDDFSRVICVGPESVSEAFGLWTPAIGAGPVRLLIRDERPFSFEIDRLLIAPAAPPTNLSCEVNAECVTPSTFPAIDDAKDALATIRIVKDSGETWLCSGALLNTTDHSFQPYLLTARHCITSPSEAASAQFTFGFQTPCDGWRPSDEGTAVGAELLALTQNDGALLRLNSDPPGSRFYLGWSEAPVPDGVTLHRISHPGIAGTPEPRLYSQSISSSATACDGTSAPDYVVSTPTMGFIWEGSSGSPVMTGEAVVVGQLSAFCKWVKEPCSLPMAAIADGAMAREIPEFRTWLAPTPASPPAAPTNLRGTRNSQDATLQWDDNSSDETLFNIYFKFPVEAGFTRFGTAPANALSASVGNLEPVEYQFAVAAVNAAGESALSNVLSLPPSAQARKRAVHR